ncbi:MAG: glucose-6-phosphate dehydrogenase assembly protein OpcA [Gaiellaceae bacterium]
MLENVTIRDVERELNELRDASTEPGQPPRLRTSVMTHVAWVPERWADAAHGVMAELGERHPSRVILLFPRPDDPRDVIDAEVDYRCFVRGGQEREVCSEVITLRLCGGRAKAPASIVQPLLVSDLPVFLRWRGDLPFGSRELDQLTDVADRLVVDAREWADPERAFAQLPALCDRVQTSDIAWARIRAWREAVAAMWPEVSEAGAVRVAGPKAEGLLLWRWLGTRLRREIEFEHEPAGEVELVEVEGRAAVARLDPKSPADLLSDQLEIFGRDRIYEETVRSFS